MSKSINRIFISDTELTLIRDKIFHEIFSHETTRRNETSENMCEK